MGLMGSAKPLASLSSGLLARKGAARPAMRPQGFGGGFASAGPAVDDLGWNDMGHGEPPAPVAVDEAAAIDAPVPSVLVERDALKDMVEAAPEAAPVPVAEAADVPQAVRAVSVATASRLRRETAHRGKAAFTLRLDAERHLKLRLASAITGQSAQAFVTLALDQYLHSLPEVDALVAQLPPATRKR